MTCYLFFGAVPRSPAFYYQKVTILEFILAMLTVSLSRGASALVFLKVFFSILTIGCLDPVPPLPGRLYERMLHISINSAKFVNLIDKRKLKSSAGPNKINCRILKCARIISTKCFQLPLKRPRSDCKVCIWLL